MFIPAGRLMTIGLVVRLVPCKPDSARLWPPDPDAIFCSDRLGEARSKNRGSEGASVDDFGHRPVTRLTLPTI